MADADIHDYMAKWRDLVGGFILAFGDIKLITIRLWRNHVGENPIPHQFKERTGRVLSALRRAGDRHATLIIALEEALRIADKRQACRSLYITIIYTDDRSLEGHWVRMGRG